MKAKYSGILTQLGCSENFAIVGNIICILSSYLLLRQLLTATHLADLMALVIPARSTISTVVFALTACAFTTSLALLLDRLLTLTV